jgi:GAF domain-containing protein
MAAAAVIVAVVTVDVAVGDSLVLIGLLSAAPLLCGLTSTPRWTRAVGLTAIVAAALSFAWNEHIGDWSYWVPLIVVSMCSAFGYLMAVFRRRLARDSLRFSLLARVAGVGHEELDVEGTAREIARIFVPDVLDLVLIDLVDESGQVRRLVGDYSGDPDVLAAFMARPPSPGAAIGSAAHGLGPRDVQHLPHIDSELRRGMAHDEEDLRLLERMAVDSAILVPLVARDRTIGVLTVGTCRPRTPLDADSVQFARTVAGRVALAIDNAALSAAIRRSRVQLEAILGSVAAAVIVRDQTGALVYANQSAADLLRLPDVAALRAATSAELMGRFDVYTEDGDPIDLADLPGTRILRGESDPPSVIVRNVVRETGEERWLLNHASRMTAADGRVMAVNLIEDVTATKRGEIAQRVLAETSRQMAEATDVAATLQAVVDSAVPGFADWAGVDLVDEDGEISTVAIAHRDPEMVRLGWRLRTHWPVDAGEPGGLAAVVRTGEPQLVREVTDDMLRQTAHDLEHLEVLRAVGLRSTMIVPLVAGPDRLGALSFVSSTSRRFDDADLALACDLGRQAGLAIRNAQMEEERAAIAHTLQSSLLPDFLPELEGWEVSGVYRPAGRLNEVGGDFYDIVPLLGGSAVIIGDVVGKGAEAAAVTALVRNTMESMIEHTGDPAVALDVVNRRLRRHRAPLPTLCTMCVVTLLPGDEVTIWSAGHPLPLLRRGHEAREVGRSGVMLGVSRTAEIPATTFKVVPGDQLLLYTDGVTDAVGRAGRFGEERLRETVSSPLAASSDSLAHHVLLSIEAFSAGPQNDDIAMLSLARRSEITAKAA